MTVDAIVVPGIVAPTIDTIPAHAGEVVRALITCADFNPNVARESWFNLDSGLGSASPDSDLEIQANLFLRDIFWQTSNNFLTLRRSGTGSLECLLW